MSNSKSPLPKNWPANITYITTSTFSKTLTASHRSTLHTRSEDAQDIPSNTLYGPCPIVRITVIASPSHPANGQNGLFTTRDLKPGTFILQYVGEIHYTAPPPRPQQPSSSPLNPPPIKTGTNSVTQRTINDTHAESNYDLSLSREHGISIDADQKGNEARFINDYRGVADRPNAEFREIWDKNKMVRGMGVWVLNEGRNSKGKAGKGGIRKGEEILVSYGRGFWGARKVEVEAGEK